MYITIFAIMSLTLSTTTINASVTQQSSLSAPLHHRKKQSPIKYLFTQHATSQLHNPQSSATINKLPTKAWELITNDSAVSKPWKMRYTIDIEADMKYDSPRPLRPSYVLLTQKHKLSSHLLIRCNNYSQQYIDDILVTNDNKPPIKGKPQILHHVTTRGSVRSIATTPTTLAVAYHTTPLNSIIDLYVLQSQTPQKPIASLTASERDQYILTLSDNTIASHTMTRTISLWDIAAGKITSVMTGESPIYDWGVLSHKNIVTTDIIKEKVYIWDVGTGRCSSILKPRHRAYQITVTPRGTLLSWGSDNYIQEWDSRQFNKPISSIRVHTEKDSCIVNLTVLNSDVIAYTLEDPLEVSHSERTQHLHIHNTITNHIQKEDTAYQIDTYDTMLAIQLERDKQIAVWQKHRELDIDLCIR